MPLSDNNRQLIKRVIPRAADRAKSGLYWRITSDELEMLIIEARQGGYRDGERLALRGEGG